jgi:hypothetical protein
VKRFSSLFSGQPGLQVNYKNSSIQIKSKSNQILFVTYTWLADVNASVAKLVLLMDVNQKNKVRQTRT